MCPEEEFREIDGNDSWSVKYAQLREEAALKHDFSLQDSKHPDFRSRNRYRDVSPYDHSRVRLLRHDIDYINASLVEVSSADRRYILAQGPLPATCGHFWLLVWEQDTRAVIMLNNVIERGRVKCHQYFPLGEAGEAADFTFLDVDLQVRFLEEQDHANFVVRTLEIEDLQSGSVKQVLQFHYTTWPDFGVPRSPEAFLQFLMCVREAGVLESGVGPPVIHCSAGIGRSGTFCLVDTCLVMAERSRSTQSVSVLDILLDMRRYRMGLIQTPDQLRFSYLAINYGVTHVLHLPDKKEVDPEPVESQPLLPSSPLAHNGDVSAETHADANTNSLGAQEGPDAGAVKETEEERDMPPGIRRRLREERRKNTREQLERMKAKQRDSELWRERGSRWRPRALLVGAACAALAAGLAYWMLR